MDKRIKVLALSYLFPNKVMPNHGIFVLNRLKALSKYVDIRVINPIPWFPLQGILNRYKNYSQIPDLEDIDGLQVYHPRFFSIPRYLKSYEGEFYYSAIMPVVQKLREDFKFDIVDMHWTFPDLPAGIKIADKYDTPSIVTLRGMEALHLNENTVRPEVVKNGLMKVDQVIALSKELKDKGDLLSKNSEKSTVIINGVDTKEFLYIPMKSSRDKLGISRNEKFVLSVGSLIKRKGFDILIKAIKSLQENPEFQDIKLYLIGSEGPEGDYRDELFQLISSLGLNDSVIFVGQVPNSELKYWYNSCDVYCLASHGEGSPNVLSEALACGCPVISSDVGSARDIIQLKDGLGVCLDENNDDNFMQAISKIMKSNISRELAAEAYAEYDWDWCARQVLPIYNKSLDQRAG